MFCVYCHRLQQHIAGQREGLEELLGCLEAWELSKKDGVASEPLVIAITGPTGTAYLSSQCIACRHSTLYSTRFVFIFVYVCLQVLVRVRRVIAWRKPCLYRMPAHPCLYFATRGFLLV